MIWGAYTANVMARFWAKVKIRGAGDCWEWQASKRRAYGKIRIKCEYVPAHRVAWMLTHGEIPEGLCVLHRCDNPPCVNPDHLFLGTLKDNSQDMLRKLRRPSMVATHHRCGHRKSVENTYVSPTGYIYCRACNRQKRREYVARKRKG